MDADQEAIVVDAERKTPAAECVLVQTTIGDKDGGMLLARAILDARLAAGVQVTGPTYSLYWYEGDFGDAEEWQVEVVTTLASLPLLEASIAENHPYFNPDIRVLPIRGNDEYVAWISREVGAGRADPAESGSAADA
jgi:periplasmic divalent cation tolerance protein